MASLKFAKPETRAAEKRRKAAAIRAIDKAEREKVKARSGGRCEVIIVRDVYHARCSRRASENHHLISGSGKRNHGPSILAAHRLHCCGPCHHLITNHVLVPVDGTQKEDAATVKYERRK